MTGLFPDHYPPTLQMGLVVTQTTIHPHYKWVWWLPMLFPDHYPPTLQMGLVVTHAVPRPLSTHTTNGSGVTHVVPRPLSTHTTNGSGGYPCCSQTTIHPHYKWVWWLPMLFPDHYPPTLQMGLVVTHAVLVPDISKHRCVTKWNANLCCHKQKMLLNASSCLLRLQG